MSVRTAALAAATVLTVVGCSGPRPGVHSPASAVPAVGASAAEGSTPQLGSPPSAIRVVSADQADLHLWVSNQSFKDDPVIFTVAIDGIVVVAQPFEVGSQHNWILFPIKASPGRHIVDVVSDTGVEVQEPFTLPETGRRYAVIDYWTYPGDGDRRITWQFRSDPVAFL
ncbi:hypothetical protein GCM10022225_77530 [Plantactinospora mayteni]|uniref:Lipoprotein n=1 Tax=Plantactinospora mayteni TaxID=566021 RepID=A0ABQ4F2V1_9ACTN|nr:hypothetical protein [Plantactinospora mayteni]GIH01187.1 hypothetical protein Pma05_77590 [Plantactinospora mayteni]